jgi:hypothetical protein
MTPEQHADQRNRVADSLLRTDELREHRRDVYSRHPLSQAVPQGEPTIGSIAQSIRELGEMLTRADQHPDFRTRLEEIENVVDRVSNRVAAARAIVTREYEGMLGCS